MDEVTSYLLTDECRRGDFIEVDNGVVSRTSLVVLNRSHVGLFVFATDIWFDCTKVQRTSDCTKVQRTSECTKVKRTSDWTKIKRTSGCTKNVF